MDLDAAVVQAIIIRDFLKYYAQCIIRGRADRNTVVWSVNMLAEPVREMYWGSGLSDYLRGKKVPMDNIIPFNLQETRTQPLRPGITSLRATQVLEYLLQCLNHVGHKLDPDEVHQLGKLLGEVIDNAETHSSVPYYYLVCHFEKLPRPDSADRFGRLQFAIVNFGQSIYERLKDPTACLNKRVVEEMRALSSRYTQNKWYQLFGRSGDLQEETLWTLYALQDGVSSVAGRRGNGTMEFVSQFLSLREEEPDNKSSLLLLSGNTRIRFDGKYPIEEQQRAGERHRIITFNPEKSFDYKPDADYVTFAPRYFPGTLLYADLYLASHHLADKETTNGPHSRDD